MFSGSFYLTDKFEPVATTNLQAGSYEFNNGQSYKIGVGKITKDVSDFKTVTKQVIANLEGGYYNPAYHGTGDARYNTSGETMFGIDRKNGGTINTSKAGVEFWKLIEEAQKTKKWKWNYVPPDPLQTQLVDLAVQMIEPGYNDFIKRYVESKTNGKQVSDIINQDGRLKFNFVYGAWNGPGWFQGYSNKVVAAYNSGKKTPDELVKVFIAARLDSTDLLKKGKPVKNGSSWSLQNQSGIKIAKLIGVNV